MLYLDSSALMKRYVIEKGSDALNARLEHGENVYTSLLSFGEIHAALARAFRMKRLTAEDLNRSREAFLNDWSIGMSAIEVSVDTMASLPALVENYLLKAADAIHLSTAVWLRGSLRVGKWSGKAGGTLEFGVADNQLAKVARECGFQVFNPEDED